MKILIVEDETAAYESLVEILKEIDPTITVIGNTESVSQTINWLNKGPLPDLILMDIHLSDGSSFLIFEHIEIEIPVIFTTAYDEYAIQAFKVNSVDYLLKPIKTAELEHALEKFAKLSGTHILDYLAKVNQLAPMPHYKDKLLIPLKDKLLPVAISEVSFFYTTDKNTLVGLADGSTFPYPKTLEHIFSTLNPANFYRGNKQYIIARNAVKDITVWFDSRLLVTLDREVPERIYISKNKAADFKEWLVSE